MRISLVYCNYNSKRRGRALAKSRGDGYYLKIMSIWRFAKRRKSRIHILAYQFETIIIRQYFYSAFLVLRNSQSKVYLKEYFNNKGRLSQVFKSKIDFSSYTKHPYSVLSISWFIRLYFYLSNSFKESTLLHYIFFTRTVEFGK